jgi:hypothetical protein
MNHRVRMSAAAIVAASCLVFTGCNASVAPSASGAADVHGAAGDLAPIPQSVSNISGDYMGTVKDGQGGNGTAKGTLAQHNSDAGGAIRVKGANQSVSVEVSLAVSSTNSTSGAMVVDYPPAGSGPVSTFSTTGTYDRSSNVLRGSYTAVHGCGGDTGTYKLTQLCHDTVVSGNSPSRLNNPHC